MSEEEAAKISPELVERVTTYFRELAEQGIEDADQGRLVDGPEAMKRIREKLDFRRKA